MRFSDLRERVEAVRESIRRAAERGGLGQEVRIVAVTKTYGPEAVEAAIDAGLDAVGENRIQEALGKKLLVTRHIEWHLIGHLQRNKVKSVDEFALVHSIDSDRLAEAVSAHGIQRGRPVDVLVQVNVSGEDTKGGFEAATFAEATPRLVSLEGLRIRGVMTMAPLDATGQVLRQVFAGARAARDRLRDAGCPADELSMGMSNDFEIAVEEGATLVRLGTLLFGVRGT